MNMTCTKYYRMIETSHRPGGCPPGGTVRDGARHSLRRRGGRWLGAAVAAALVLIFLLQGGHPPSNAQEIAWLKRLAAADNPDAQLQLGLAYREGRYGLVPDARAGQYWLGRAARNGQEYAIENLAGAAAVDKTVTADTAETSARGRLDTLAMQLKSPTLATVAALWKILGLGLTGSQSSDALQQRAEAGDPVAEFQLAMRYRDGAWSVNRDPAKALYWLKRAADAGNPLAMKDLAEVYRSGALGSERDLDKAVHWQRRAAALSGPHG
jgi:TPR repeat protein